MNTEVGQGHTYFRAYFFVASGDCFLEYNICHSYPSESDQKFAFRLHMTVYTQPMTVAEVEWKRMAKPQVDKYDSLITLKFAEQKGHLHKSVEGGPRIFDGHVALTHDDISFPDGCVPAHLDHSNITNACEIIRLWQEGYAQCQLLLKSVTPLWETDRSEGATGAISGGGKEFGTIASTINSEIGLAHSIVHELAHHKLRALGIELESAEQIIKLTPHRLFRSPIRYDKLRPMSAVLHAQYSYTYVTALNISILSAHAINDSLRGMVLNALADHIPKLEFGFHEIESNVIVDAAGEDFIEGYRYWLESLLSKGKECLEACKVEAYPFAHPLDSSGNRVKGTHTTVDLFLLKIPKKHSEVTESNLEDEVIVYTPCSETVYTFNPTAKLIWEYCDGIRSISEICEALGNRFNVDPSIVFPDVKQVFVQLYSYGIVE